MMAESRAKINSPAFAGLLRRVTSQKNLSLRFGPRCCSGRSRRFLARCSLNAGSLAAKFAQIIQPRAPHFALADHLDRADCRRMQRENSLDAHAKAHTADGKRRAGGPALL